MQRIIKPFYFFAIFVLYSFQPTLQAQPATSTATFTGRILPACEIENANDLNIALNPINVAQLSGSSATAARRQFNIVFKNCAPPGGNVRVTLSSVSNLAIANGVLANEVTQTNGQSPARNAGIKLSNDNGTPFTGYGTPFNIGTDLGGRATLSMAADYGLNGQGVATPGDVKATITITASPQ